MPIKVFKQLPWIGGINTSLDESMIPSNQLTVGDNVVFGTRGSRKKRDGINNNWDSATSNSLNVIALHDYWYGTSTRTKKLVSIMSDGSVYSYTGGTRTQLTVGGTAWTGTLTSASFLTFGNILLIAVSGPGNVMKYWDGTSSVLDVPGTPPNASILREHLGRVICNDKDNADLLHYSPVGDYTQWKGAGDSGALPIGEGDGDPVGLTAIFPTFKGTLFVAKLTKLYRISGYSPEDLEIKKVSNGIGCVSHNTVIPIDQDDIFFVSEKGVHSLQATQAYGDFTSNYVSIDIQKTFNEGLDKTRLQFGAGAYLDSLNSAAFAFSTQGSPGNDVLYLYNIPNKSWYRWPNLSCQSILVSHDADRKRFYFGTATGRVTQALANTNYDISETGVKAAIPYQVDTGIIYVDNDPYTMKGFKRFILFYNPSGSHSLAVTVKIDNFQISPENELSFSQSNSTDLLGSTFGLGTSMLGYSAILGPYTATIDGYGRGCKISITQSGIDESVEIQGFGIEYEDAGINGEVLTD